MPSWDARQGEPVSSQDEVEEFAALLRRLKARTDRSYAALARRLNMNASTLHRYCAGDAVPLGFAPVERFAALCEASPAERTELHRRWILAVAARQRPRPGAESVPEAAEARAAGHEGPMADEAPALVPAATADAVSTPAADTVPTPAADIASATLADTVSTTAVDTASTTPADTVSTTAVDTASTPLADTASTPPGDFVPAAPVGSVPAAAPDPSPGSRETPSESLPGSSRERAAASRPASRKPWYRRRVTVTAAVVIALIATLGSLSALPSGHSSATGDDQASGTRTTRTAGARHGSPTPSAPPSTARGRSSGSPSPKAPSTGNGSPGPSTGPSPTAASAVVPLTWTVNSHRWAVGCAHNYILDKAPGQVPPPPAPQDASPWARTQNGVHGGQTLVDITVQGQTDAAVVLEALQVRVVGRSAPLKGTAYSTGGGCGGSMGPGSFAVDLDMDRPLARPVPSDDDGTGSRTLRMPFRVSVKDPQVLMVDAQTEACDCRWYLELDWSSRGRTGTVRIDDQGVPFRTSGIKGLPHYWYGEHGWTLLPD
ncbi:helix-turn-helix domain-containing protein [Streptomyces sp. NBC_00647]|uniref:helix-turn-helix domain-containing protein n=1 Tax=Streptomyces sp. NBC_00647 TaxID=2975796 RepID=UPI003247ED79